MLSRWKKTLLSVLDRAGPASPATAPPPETTSVPEVAEAAHWLSAPENLTPSDDPTFAYHPLELALPNQWLRSAVSGPDLDRFLYIGAAWATVCSRYLPRDREVHVLDIGCGVGKMARFFALNPNVHYIGFDIFEPGIQWCRQAFSRLYQDRFRFEHFDGHSAMYNPDGQVATRDYAFPAEDGSIDLAVGASIFTHLYEADMQHYLAQTRRVLAPGGLAVFSIHTLDEIDAFFPGANVAPDEKIKGNEQVMLIDKDHFVTLAGRQGLTLKDSPGRLCGQELVVLENSPDRAGPGSV